MDLESHISGVEGTSSDEILLNLIDRFSTEAKIFNGMCVQAPLSWPPFFRLLNSTGKISKTRLENDAEVKWMNAAWERLKPRPRPFEPYLQRAAEIQLKFFSQEKFQIPDAFGSNLAPLAARMSFLRSQLKAHFQLTESYPRGIVARLTSQLAFPKSWIKTYSDLEKGFDTRSQFLELLLKKVPQIFIYEKDLEVMTQHLSAFHSFLLALNQHLSAQNCVEKAPKSFPRNATWIELPKSRFDWASVV